MASSHKSLSSSKVKRFMREKKHFFFCLWKGSKHKKDFIEKTTTFDERYLDKIENFFKIYKKKNDRLFLPEVLDRLDLLGKEKKNKNS